MKKLVMMFTMLTVGVAIMAAGNVPYTPTALAEVDVLVKTAKYTEAKAALNALDITEAGQAWIILLKYARVSFLENGKVDTVDAAKTRVAALVPLAGDLLIPIAINATEMQMLIWSFKDQLAYDYFNTLPVDAQKVCVIYFWAACDKLKKYDDGIAALILYKKYQMAMLAYAKLGNKDKIFEYGKKAALSDYLSASNLILVLDTIGSQDYADTSVTTTMQVEFLKAVDLKYRRFLVTDKNTWEPIIAGVRITLQGLGVEVK